MKNKKRMRLIRAALLLIVIVSLTQSVRAYSLSVKNKKQQENLKEQLYIEYMSMEEYGSIPEDETARGQETNSEDAEELEEQKGLSAEEVRDEPVMLSKFKNLYEENQDLAGWLSIEGMGIDYPVMQCNDNDYYLHHDFYGQESKYGCLFVKDIADITTPDTNVVIYGHNMKDGAMFGDLDLYKEESFYRSHPLISFDTLYEERTYEIVAVFLSQIYGEDEDVFKYYDFYNAETLEEFKEFYWSIKMLSLYDIEAAAEFGDTFLTLSTCAYHVEDGRFVVVAKRVE